MVTIANMTRSNHIFKVTTFQAC